MWELGLLGQTSDATAAAAAAAGRGRADADADANANANAIQPKRNQRIDGRNARWTECEAGPTIDRESEIVCAVVVNEGGRMMNPTATSERRRLCVYEYVCAALDGDEMRWWCAVRGAWCGRCGWVWAPSALDPASSTRVLRLDLRLDCARVPCSGPQLGPGRLVASAAPSARGRDAGRCGLQAHRSHDRHCERERTIEGNQAVPE